MPAVRLLDAKGAPYVPEMQDTFFVTLFQYLYLTLLQIENDPG